MDTGPVTSDDEFIRQIVDNPGDDTPRLVYSDWLEELNDPRAEYLRREHEAVQNARREGLTFASHSRLLNMSVDFDPVWVTRVSRPPIGVCCDDRVFSGANCHVTRPVIDRISGQYGLAFAPTHIAFLLNYNGGSPEPSTITLGDRTFELNWFYDIRFPEGVPPDTVFSAIDQMQGPLESFIARWKFKQKEFPSAQPRRSLSRQFRDWFHGPTTLPVPAVENTLVKSAPLAFGWGKTGGSLSIESSGACTIYHANNEALDFMRTIDRDPLSLPRLLYQPVQQLGEN